MLRIVSGNIGERFLCILLDLLQDVDLVLVSHGFEGFHSQPPVGVLDELIEERDASLALKDNSPLERMIDSCLDQSCDSCRNNSYDVNAYL